MKLKSKSKRRSCPLMRLRFIARCVGWISRLISDRPSGVMLGHHVKGDRDGLWVGRRGNTVLPLGQLRKHVLAFARAPEEKNRIASRFVNGVAREYRAAQVFFFDSDGDPETARAFSLATNRRGQRSLLFPDQPFNAWTGDDWRPIFDRLLRALPLAKAGSAANHAETTKLVLQLACRFEGRPPRSSGELLERLDYMTLRTVFGEEMLPGVKETDVLDVSMRLEGLFTDLGSSLDGKRSFADLDSAYFSLYPLARADATRMLLAQLLDYIQHEKDPHRLCVVLLRIPAVVASDASLALLLEQARAYGVVVVPILQSLADTGSPDQMLRLLGSAETLILNGDQVRSGLATGIRLTESVAAMSPLDDPLSSRERQGASKLSRDDLLRMPRERVLVISKGKGALIDVSSAS